MPDYDLPMREGPTGAVAGLASATPMKVNTEVPFQVKAPPPIDLFEDTLKAYKLADTQDKFKTDQVERLDKTQKIESAQRDQAILSAFTKAGHGLHTDADISIALQDVGDKLSPQTRENLEQQRDAFKENKAKTMEMMARLPPEMLAHLHDTSTAFWEQTRPLVDEANYLIKQNPNNEAQIRQDFTAKKAALFQKFRGQQDPFDSTKPLYDPALLDTVENAGLEASGEALKRTKLGVDFAKEVRANNLNTSTIEKNKAETELASARTDSVKKGKESNIAVLDADLKEGRITQSEHDAEVKKLTDTSGRGAAVDPKVIDNLAHEIVSLHRAPPSGFGQNTPTGLALSNRVYELDPGYDPTKWEEKLKARKDFGTGAIGNSIKSANTAVQHMSVLRDLSGALKNKETKKVNELFNYLGAEFGSEAPPSFEAAVGLVGDELANAVIGSKGAVSDREGIQQKFKSNAAPGQIEGVLDTYTKLMGGRIATNRDQYVRTHLGDEESFNQDFLNDDTRKALGIKLKESKTTGHEDFPKVTPAEQSARDNDAIPILQGELATKQEELKKATTEEDKHRIQQNIEELNREIARKGGAKTTKKDLPKTNSEGWVLHKDAKGNQAYVSPDGKQFKEVGQ